MQLNRSGWITIIILVLVLIVATGALFHLRQQSEEQKRLESPAGTALASENSSFKQLDGTPVEIFSDEERVIIAYAWASWCPQCRADLVSLGQFAATMNDTNVLFVAINRNEPSTVAERFIADLHLPPELQIVIDANDQYYDLIDGYAMPELVVFSKAGDEVLRQRGMIDLNQIDQTIDSLNSGE